MDLEGFFSGDSGLRRLAVAGWPLSHSLSPAMHSAAMAHFGLTGEYRAIPVPPLEWAAFVKSAKAGLSGMNITLPYKEQAWLDFGSLSGAQTDTYTRLARSANTLVRRPDGWMAANTDGQGLLDDFKHLGISIEGRDVVVLGAGGAARSTIFAFQLLSSEIPRSVAVINRTPGRAQRILAELTTAPRARRFPVRFVESAGVGEAIRRAALVINATSLGLAAGDAPAADPSFLHGGQIFYDLIYHRETELLKAARVLGARSLGGLGMLVAQGALAFELWFRDELKNVNYTPLVLRQVMRQAAESALKEKKES